MKSSPIQCIGPSCTRRPMIVNQLEREVIIGNIRVDKIYACTGHDSLADKIAREKGVGVSKSSPEWLITLQEKALEFGTLKSVSLTLPEKKRIGRWRESHHGPSPEY